MGYTTLASRRYKQDARPEAKDAKGVLVRAGRTARDELEVVLRQDGQFKATLRVPRQSSPSVLEKSARDLALGEEIVPGVRIVEVEEQFNEAQDAKHDERGAITREAIPESTEYRFTLRLDNIHLTKIVVPDAFIKSPAWRETLASMGRERL